MNAGNIVLVGFMGTGKSAVGRRLAARLQRSFVDMDERIEASAGKPISRIFSEDGEPAFRRMERALVEDLARRTDLVIATGGGIVLDPRNIEDFSRTGMVVCLTASVDEILRRVGSHRHRPLLERDDKREAVRDLMDKRRPLYEAIPRRVDTTHRTAGAVAQSILGMLEESAGSRS